MPQPRLSHLGNGVAEGKRNQDQSEGRGMSALLNLIPMDPNQSIRRRQKWKHRQERDVIGINKISNERIEAVDQKAQEI